MRKTLLSILLSVFTLFSVAFAQNKTISGKVTAASDGLALPGVGVSVKGRSGIGTQTDANGNYRLSVPENAETLVFQYIGFLAKEVSISGNVLNVVLSEDQKQLSEVVVVGYGTQIKQDLTGSISGVKAKDIENLPLPSFETALQGRASGVFINQGSGKLGQGINIRIRGISSVSASSQPLFVIDGIPVESRALGTATEPDNPLASIAPEDIESIDILKDASASAIYGSRAANGVVLVTTKTGKVGKTKISLNYFTGTSEPTKKRDWLNRDQYIQLFSDAANNSSLNGEDWELNNPEDAWLAYGAGTDDWANPSNTDWANEAFQTGAISQYSVSAQGGDAKTRFFISGSYNDQKGIMLANEFNRANGRINLDHSIKNNLKIGVNLSLSKSVNYRVASDNAFTNPLQLNAIPPIQPIRDAEGNLNTTTLYYNVLRDLEGASAVNKQFRSLSTGFLNWDIIPGLTLRSEFGFDLIQLEEENYNSDQTLDGAPTGLAFNNQVRSSNYNTNNTLSYSKNFGKHNFQILGGLSYQEGRNFSASASAQGFPNKKFTKIASAAIINGGSSSETAFSFLSYFSRLNYKFNNKYLLGASVRIDGSSRFGADNRYGTFPSVSGGWIISEEELIKKIEPLSFLKLRASYGTTGNSEIGNFSALSLYASSPYADQSGIVFSQIGVDDLRWEKTNQLDLGLDFGFFKNRISGEVDYFEKKTSDLLLNFQLPAINGFTNVTRNVGGLENKGWEFTLNTENLVGKFKWSSNFNISTYRNKIVNMDGTVINGGQRQLGTVREGLPFGTFYGTRYAGVNPANGNAQYFNEDGTIVDQDDYDGFEQVVGDPNPEFYGGFGNKFSFKGFDLDIQSQFVYGNDLYNIAGFFQSVNGDYYDNQSTDQLNYWKNPGDITNIPQPRLLDGNGAIKSSRWVQDGSYFRIKNVVFGYSLPKSLIGKLKIDNARIYVAGQNLFTFTNYEGYDPEVNATYTGNVNLGHDFYTPPQARTITFGINLGF